MSKYWKGLSIFTRRPHLAVLAGGQGRRALLLGASAMVVLSSLVGAGYALYQLLLIAPFGATAILVLTSSDRPIMQPRSIVLSYLLAVPLAVLSRQWLGSQAYAPAMLTGLALGLLLLADALHPPGVATLLVLAPQPPIWCFLLVPLLPGLCLILGLGWTLHTFVTRQRYPNDIWW